jgi:hypothetical protein
MLVGGKGGVNPTIIKAIKKLKVLPKNKDYPTYQLCLVAINQG